MLVPLSCHRKSAARQIFRCQFDTVRAMVYFGDNLDHNITFSKCSSCLQSSKWCSSGDVHRGYCAGAALVHTFSGIMADASIQA